MEHKDIIKTCEKPFIFASLLFYFLGALANNNLSVSAIIGCLGAIMIAAFCLFMLLLALLIPKHITKEKGILQEIVTVLCFFAFIGICIKCVHFSFILGATIR